MSSVEVRGVARVGRQLTAAVGPVYPEDARTTYRWLRDGDPLPGATGSTYRVVRADRGDRLAVRVTATARTYERTVVTSAWTAVVRR